MHKRTQESEKRETDRLILDALIKSDLLNPKRRKLTFTELHDRTKSFMGRATLSRALRRMQRENKITRVVDAPVGRPVVIRFSPGPEAPKAIVPTRKHYEALAKQFDASLSPDRYMRRIQQALGESLVWPLLTSLRDKSPVIAEPIYRDFKFLIAKWIVYHKTPKLTDIKEIIGTFQDLDQHPENYVEEIQELQKHIKPQLGVWFLGPNAQERSE